MDNKEVLLNYFDKFSALESNTWIKPLPSPHQLFPRLADFVIEILKQGDPIHKKSIENFLKETYKKMAIFWHNVFKQLSQANIKMLFNYVPVDTELESFFIGFKKKTMQTIAFTEKGN